MSLYLLLIALQADAPLDPPPLKIKPVVVQPTPTMPTAPAVNPTIIYTPAPKPSAVPSASPGVTYAPARTDADPAPGAPAAPAAPLAAVSAGARERLAVERQADAERRVELRREMAAVNDGIAKALATTPLDVAALKAALERRDEVMARSRAKVTDAVIDLLGDIAPDDRLTVARALIERDSGRPSQPTPQTQARPDPSPVGR